MTDERRILELALVGLDAERSRIEREISEINKRLRQPYRESRRDVVIQDGNIAAAAVRARRRMSAAQKRKISAAMKARWAAMRKTR